MGLTHGKPCVTSPYGGKVTSGTMRSALQKQGAAHFYLEQSDLADEKSG